ncbi:MAG TPA: hypothetical protein VKV26_17510 [Dehalococcoidia bacterium]|nr:hypothetical protein [Dehalococcoidia bacterium]
MAAGTPAVAALIPAGQFGGGWARAAAPASLGDLRCAGQPLVREAGAGAEATYSKGEAGPWAAERIVRAADGGPAAFARLATLLQNCHRLQAPAPADGAIEWSLAPLPFPRLADDSLALRLISMDKARPLAADLVLFRHGDTVALVAQFATPPGPVSGTTLALVQQAEARLLRFLP